MLSYYALGRPCVCSAAEINIPVVASRNQISLCWRTETAYRRRLCDIFRCRSLDLAIPSVLHCASQTPFPSECLQGPTGKAWRHQPVNILAKRSLSTPQTELRMEAIDKMTLFPRRPHPHILSPTAFPPLIHSCSP